MNIASNNSSGLAAALYQAVWRWHFIVGLIVMPLLVMMAITSGLHFFKDEIDHLVGVSLVVALLVEMVKAMIQSKFTLTRT